MMHGARFAIVAMAVLGLVACGDTDVGTTKAGATPVPLTLRLGTPDDPGRVSQDQIQQFADHIEVLSDGELRIEPVFGAGRVGFVPDWDQVAARLVVDGTLDMGLIPARAWDTEGVMSLRALHAPFLVDSDELLGELVSGDDVAPMLGGLDVLGVTGLALWPEGLRHLFVFDPAMPIGELEGAAVQAPTSALTTALFEALGASVDDYARGDVFDRGVADGSIVAAESSFLSAHTLPTAAHAVGNVTLFPKVNSLVINTEAFEELSSRHREMLVEAAARTTRWAVHSLPSDVEVAAVYCDVGGAVMHAPASDVASLVERADSVYDELEQDEVTRRLLASIRATKERLPAAPVVAECGRPTASANRSSAPASAVTQTVGAPDVGFPDGSFRAEITFEALLAAGVDRPIAVNHAGIWTLTFDDGTIVIEDVNATTGRTSTGVGVYCVSGSRVSVGILDLPPQCGDFWSAVWEVDDDELRFVGVTTSDGEVPLLTTLFGTRPFRRVS